MENKKWIQFAHSLVLLPFLTSMLSFGNIATPKNLVDEKPETISIEQQNKDSFSILFRNNVDVEEEILSQKALAIDTYFEKKGMPLLGLGRKMVIEAEANDLDWRLIAAISVRESTGGKYACKGASFNPFGWGSCKINFKSYEEAIKIVAHNLGGNNPNTARYYKDNSVEEKLYHYNGSVIPAYTGEILEFMELIENQDVSKLIAKSV